MTETLIKALEKAKQDDFVVWDEPNDTSILTSDFGDVVTYYYEKSKKVKVFMVIA